MCAVHINKPALSAADRLLIERLAHTLPVRYAEADKFVNADVVDTCCELVGADAPGRDGGGGGPPPAPRLRTLS
jgi:hypothetical protein